MKSQHAPTVASIYRDQQFMLREIVEVKTQIFNLRRQLRKDEVRKLVLEVAAEEMARQKKLAHDVNGLMELLLDKGVVIKAELSEACR